MSEQTKKEISKALKGIFIGDVVEVRAYDHVSSQDATQETMAQENVFILETTGRVIETNDIYISLLHQKAIHRDKEGEPSFELEEYNYHKIIKGAICSIRKYEEVKV